MVGQVPELLAKEVDRLLDGASQGEQDDAARRAEVESLDAELTREAADINAAMARWLAKLSRFDALGGWSDQGATTPQQWLSWKCGVAGPLGRRYVQVARAMPERRHVTRAFASGEMSFSKAEAICSVASDETEEMLVDWARSTTANQMETIARTYRNLVDRSELDDLGSRRAARHLRYHFASDGDLRLSGRLPAEHGARFVKAIEAAAEDERAEMGLSDTRTWEQREADALVALAERSLAERASDASDPERFLTVLNVDFELLLNDRAQGTCDLDGVTGVHPETGKRLLCDCSLVSLLHKDGEVFDQGRKTRVVSRRMRRALKARDKTCCWPGCERAFRLEAHHIHHWLHGGKTKASNLELYCSYHHHRLHEGGYSAEKRDGRTVILDRFGNEVEPAPIRRAERMVGELNEELGLEIDRETIIPPTYYGDPMQLDLVIDVLYQRDNPRDPPDP